MSANRDGKSELATLRRQQPRHFRAGAFFYVGDTMPFRLTPPTQLTFIISVALAILAVVARVLVYMDIEMPVFPTGGFLLLLIGYLVLLAGNLLEGM